MHERDYSHLSSHGQKRMAKFEAKMNERFLASQLKVSSDAGIMRAAHDYSRISKLGIGDNRVHVKQAKLGTLKLSADMDRQVVAGQLSDVMVDRGLVDHAKMYFPDMRERIETRAIQQAAKRLFGWLFRFW